jgi:intracellular sulfur oxidation DsrE/DsrF family protein
MARQKKIAYLITRSGTRELVEGCLLTTVSTGRHGARVVAMHFAEDGVYHLVRGTAAARKVARAMKEQGVKVLACECSLENRNLRDKILPGVKVGHFADFYAAAAAADHVVAI